MAATVTLSKVLQLVAKLTADEQKELVDAVKERQRKRAAWLRQLEKDVAKARGDSKAGKLKSFRTANELMAHLDKLTGFANE